MDFLDSIDLKTKRKKSSRVRSWYLYEQYKSLERNQLDAAQRLKDRTYQDRILRQELSERRARRKLYDQFGLCQSESCIEKSASEGNKTALSASTDDFFESFCELQVDEKSPHVSDSEDTYSQDDSQTSKRYLDDFKDLDDIKDDQSLTDSVNSVVQNHKSNNNYTEESKEEIQIAEKSLAEEINLQFETVKENIQCLEKYSKLCSDDKISEVDSLESFGEVSLKKVSCARHDSDINLFNIWSKLVSFAYQVIQLNHGNCYYDYSSQFLTAVLACDVVRRGLNKMCHILQPYVSPIKFATDESDSSTASPKSTRRKSLLSKKSGKPVKATPPTSRRNKRCRSRNKCISEDYWRNISRHTFGCRKKVKHRCSEPWRSAVFSTCQSETSESSSCSIWPLSSTCRCTCHGKVTNPMMKIGQYIDRLLNDIDDCTRA